eukprot:gene16438-11754_t
MAYMLPTEQWFALQDLYINNGGDGWFWRTPYSSFGYPWNFSDPNATPCSSSEPWQGLACTSDCASDPCEHLDLSFNDLSGQLPQSFWTLRGLSYADLSFNDLTGPLSEAISGLISVQKLILKENHFTSTIPPSIGSLPTIEDLDLSVNHLSGPLPSAIGQLRSLLTMDVSGNHLHLSLPQSICNLSSLSTLTLNYNAFTGRIPSCLGDMAALTSVVAFKNRLTGTIPPELGQLQRLSHFDVSTNQLTGAIPSALGNATNITVALWKENYLHGSVPASLSRWSMVDSVDLSSNLLTGVFPPFICQWIGIQSLGLADNRLTGTLPNDVDCLQALQFFTVSGNLFHGTVPAGFGSIPNLQSIDLTSNALTGTIPDELWLQGELENVALGFNSLTGTVSPTIGQLQTLLHLNLAGNHLHGTVPPSLSNCSFLSSLRFDDNALTGTTPASLSDLASMADVDLSHNLFTGTLAPEFGEIALLLYFDLSFNDLTGTLPAAFANAHIVAGLYLTNNHFDGTVPSAFANMAYVRDLVLSDNLLTGTIPAALLGLKYVEVLNLGGNELVGSIPTAKMANLHRLQSLVLSSNRLTGTLPAPLFAHSSLRVVLLASNCFSGGVEASVCAAVALEQLILDGLHSAPTCEQRALPWDRSSGVVVRHGVGGTIPACLFAMPQLRVLHLGGNSFSGRLPPDVSTQSGLRELVLAGNRLTGTVPQGVWMSANLRDVDLSLNRLQGTLPATALQALAQAASAANDTDGNGTATMVRLQNNQFSGAVPSTLWRLANVTVLEGNLFACNRARSDIPAHDPDYDAYSCGSDATNAALITFTVATALSLCLLSVAWATPRLWLAQFYAETRPPSGVYASVETSVWAYDRWTRELLAAVVVGGLALYSALSVVAPTYDVQFVWSVSGIYLQGTWAAVGLWLFWWALAAWSTWRLCEPFAHGDAPSSASAPLSSSASAPSPSPSPSSAAASTALRHRLVNATFVVVNVVVVGGINAAYVSAVQAGFPAGVLLFLSFLLSVFKMLWNYALMGGWDGGVAGSLGTTLSDATVVSLCLFNNLVAPFLAELLVSPSCFLYVVSQAPALHFSYTSSAENHIFDFQDYSYTVVVDSSVAVVPPFHYSYQCSSALLADYAYVFVFRYLLSGVVEPMVVWGLYVYDGPQLFQRALRPLLPLLWKLQDNAAAALETLAQTGGVAAGDTDGLVEAYAQFDESLAALERGVLGRAHRLRQKWVSRMVTDASMLLGFGAVFPPLAVVIGVSMCKDTLDLRLSLGRLQGIVARHALYVQRWEAAQARLGRASALFGGAATTATTVAASWSYTDDDVAAGLRQQWARLQTVQQRVVGEELAALDAVVRRGIWHGLCLSVCIWAFVLFDTAAATGGDTASAWVVVTMVASPHVVWAALWLWARRGAGDGRGGWSSSSSRATPKTPVAAATVEDGAVELTPLPAPSATLPSL